jgi:hypothetical protein
MAKQIVVVLSDAVSPAQDTEYNRWYTDQHLDDVLRLPGIVAAQRFKVAFDAAKSLPAPYLAIYEIETADENADPKAIFDGMSKAAESGQLPMSPAFSMENMVASVFVPISERKVKVR